MIRDLSSPIYRSVNDGIPPDLCSLQYSRVDEAVHLVRPLGQDTQLMKLDIKDAYRIVPTSPSDYALLGIMWRGHTYIDRALPFRLRSAPKIFDAVADFITWVLASRRIPYHLHYTLSAALHNKFLFLATPHSSQGHDVLSMALNTFHYLGIPVAADKTEGPKTSIIFLDILIDTHRFELCLPLEKLTNLKQLIHLWTETKSCTRKELESLLGHLSHVATILPQGCTFLRSLFSQLQHARAPHHNLRLNLSARADLKWWATFLRDRNGTSFFPAPTPTIEVTSDTSGCFGCGGFSHPYGWFQLQWPESWGNNHITIKELAPIVIAAVV